MQELFNNFDHDATDEDFDVNELSESESETFIFKENEDFSSDSEAEHQQRQLEKQIRKEERLLSKPKEYAVIQSKKLSKYEAEKLLIEKRKYFEGLPFDELKNEFKLNISHEKLMRNAKLIEKENLKSLNQYLYMKEKKKKEQKIDFGPKPETNLIMRFTENGQNIIFK